MLFSTLHQGGILAAGVFAGLLCGAADWLLGLLRRLPRAGTGVTLLADLLLGASCSAVTAWTVYRTNEGIPRLLMLLWIPVGWWIFRRGPARLLNRLLRKKPTAAPPP